MWWLNSKFEFAEIVFKKSGVFRTLENPTDCIVNMTANFQQAQSFSSTARFYNPPYTHAWQLSSRYGIVWNRSEWREYYKKTLSHTNIDKGGLLSFGEYATLETSSLTDTITAQWYEYQQVTGNKFFGPSVHCTWNSGWKDILEKKNLAFDNSKIFIATLPPNIEVPITIIGSDSKITIYYKES